MKVEFDPARDVLYVWLGAPGTKAARTEIVSAGVHADFDRQGRLIGIEVLDASEILPELGEGKVRLENLVAA